MSVSALPPDCLAWLLAQGVRAYVQMPPYALAPPAVVSASLFADACAFFLRRLDISALPPTDARKLFNSARLFAQAHASERVYCATFAALRVVEPTFSDEPNEEEIAAAAAELREKEPAPEPAREASFVGAGGVAARGVDDTLRFHTSLLFQALDELRFLRENATLGDGSERAQSINYARYKDFRTTLAREGAMRGRGRGRF